ncbi:RNA polymerase sigma-70 factor [Parapedobacter deserti]|uniref:RNA polymerase sigma-70 factor n=1 Tax=Parapedobacter deserti TaxID=1912957 RepID=A0ABV7JEX2_9SPHI
MHPDSDDSELIRRLQEGNEEAFRYIYDAFGKRLFYFARSLNLNTEDAQEIVQETFIRLWESRHRADAKQSLSAYVFSIARNLIYNQMKKWAVRQRYLTNVLQGDESVSEIRDSELGSLINQAMEEMPEKRREVFRMSRFEGYLNQRIADELGISKSTVENHLNKALKHMKKRLAQFGYGAGIALCFYFFENF